MMSNGRYRQRSQLLAITIINSSHHRQQSQLSCRSVVAVISNGYIMVAVIGQWLYMYINCNYEQQIGKSNYK